MNLCYKDLKVYSEPVREERELLARYVQQAGYEALSDYQKSAYRFIH
jgi:hypothetical protein